MDIFEKLKLELNCDYISDLRLEPNLSRAKDRVRHMELEAISTKELLDLVEYLYGYREEDRGILLSLLKG